MCRFLLVLLVLGACLGCASGWDVVKDTEDVDELRRFMRENPHGVDQGQARLRIIQLEYRAAVASNTRYDFHSFLERHPESTLALNVRKRLDDLDFRKSKASGKVEELQGYLRRHGKGRHIEEVESLLDQFRCKKGVALEAIGELTSFIKAYPGIPCQASLQEKLKGLRFEQVRAKPALDDLLAFLHDYQLSPEARQLGQMLMERQVAALLKGARFLRARKLVRNQAAAESMAPMLARVDQAEAEWKESRAAGLGRAKRLGKVASSLLRQKTRIPDKMALPSDPRLRWILADSLADQGNEETADLLLALTSDAYLEVRWRAAQALNRCLLSMDPLRTRIWLKEQAVRLESSGQAGPLLVQRALVTAMEGDVPMALHYVEQRNLASERPDLFALHLAWRWRLEHGLVREAANTASRFCDLAHQFASRREEAWRSEEGLRQGNEAWLVLRQLYGLVGLWQQVKGDERLAEHSRWLNDEETRWQASHTGYLPGVRPGPKTIDAARLRDDAASVLELACSVDPARRPILTWCACCHPSQALRALAASLQSLIVIAGQSRLGPVVVALTPWSP